MFSVKWLSEHSVLLYQVLTPGVHRALLVSTWEVTQNLDPTQQAIRRKRSYLFML